MQDLISTRSAIFIMFLVKLNSYTSYLNDLMIHTLVSGDCLNHQPTSFSKKEEKCFLSYLHSRA